MNTDTKTLTFANVAHHVHPLLLREGEVEPLVAKGMPPGMMAGINYREVEFTLQSGAGVMFMTDAIIEVHNADGREYQDSGRSEGALPRFTP